MDIVNSLVEGGKFLHAHALVIGSGGNLSIRESNFFTIKRGGADMSKANTEDYIKIPFSPSAPPEDSRLSSESLLHWACYASKGDVRAVAHAHPPYAIRAARRRNVLKSASYEFDCLVGPSIPVIPYLGPGSRELSDAVAAKIGSGETAVLMKRHGIVAVGESIEQACNRILAVERACMTL